MLLGKRFRTSAEGQWALPGGHVELNETPIATARRELREETAMVGGELEVGPSFTTYTTDLPYVHVPVLFRQADGEPRLVEGERFSDLAFFDLARLPTPLFEPSRVAMELLRSGPASLSFRTDKGSQFIKIDMVSVDPEMNRNRAFSAVLVADGRGTSLLVTWGRRDRRQRSERPEIFPELDQGLRRLELLLRRRVKHGYYVSGVAGELPLDRIAALLPSPANLQVVSRELFERLLDDAVFRDGFLQDWYLRNPTLPLAFEKGVDNEPGE